MPFGKKDNGFKFEIEIFEEGIDYRIHPFNINSFIDSKVTVSSEYTIPDNYIPDWIMQTNLQETLYNLRDIDGNPITKETRPELFWDLPFNSDYQGLAHTQLSKNMVEHGIVPHLNVSWGDGTSSIFSYKTKSITIINENLEEEVLCYDAIDINYSDYFHSYGQSGKYIITINGIVDNCYINYYSFSSNTTKIQLCRVIQWGNLNLKYLTYLVSAAVSLGVPFPTNFPDWSKVISTSHMFYDEDHQNVIKKTKLTWEILGGENFLNRFPNLVVADDMFMNSSIPYIPDYCFSKNKFLQSVNGAFEYTNLQYVGSYSFANLNYLLTIQDMCTSLYSRSDYDDMLSLGYTIREYIGDSIFENDINLIDGGRAFNDATDYPSWRKIGNRVFANCYKVLSVLEVFGYHLYLLEEVGSELFLNCTQLRKINMLFYQAINLKMIGNDMFRGCKNIEDTSDLFYQTIRLHNIPDRFFYDVEFHNTKFTMSDTFYFFTTSISYDDISTITSEKVNKFILQYYNGTVIQTFNPLLYQEMIEYYTDLIDNQILHQELYFTFGKEMFNQKFLSDIIGTEYEDMISSIEFGLQNSCRLNGQIIYIGVHCGEAPPFWNYIDIAPISGVFGYITGENAEYKFINRYDNFNDIPKEIEKGWLHIGVYEN